MGKFSFDFILQKQNKPKKVPKLRKVGFPQYGKKGPESQQVPYDQI